MTDSYMSEGGNARKSPALDMNQQPERCNESRSPLGGGGGIEATKLGGALHGGRRGGVDGRFPSLVRSDGSSVRSDKSQPLRRSERDANARFSYSPDRCYPPGRRDGHRCNEARCAVGLAYFEYARRIGAVNPRAVSVSIVCADAAIKSTGSDGRPPGPQRLVGPVEVARVAQSDQHDPLRRSVKSRVQMSSLSSLRNWLPPRRLVARVGY